MRLAYLVFAYNNPLHLKRLLQALSSGEHDIFLHIDSKSLLDPRDFAGENIFPLNERIRVYWGGYSAVRAICYLIRTAQSRDNYDRLVLLSGADYPIRSQAHITSFFVANPDINFINVVRMPGQGKPLERMKHYHFEIGTSSNRFISKLVTYFESAIKRSGFERHLPLAYNQFELYGGSTWWCITGNFANYLLDFIDVNLEFANFYRYTLIPEEMFIHTIIMNSPFRETVRPACTFTEWDDLVKSSHPKQIQKQHISLLEQDLIDSSYGQYKPLFARKFDDHSDDIIQLINDQLIDPH